MMVTVDLINDQVLNLLRDMERLNLLRVKTPEENATQPKIRQGAVSLSERLLGVLADSGITLDQARSERLAKYWQ
jgi:hypothetical protein